MLPSAYATAQAAPWPAWPQLSWLPQYAQQHPLHPLMVPLGVAAQPVWASAMPPAHVFVAEKPWQMSPAQHVNFTRSLQEQAAALRPISPPTSSSVVDLRNRGGSAVVVDNDKRISGKKGQPERTYSPQEFRQMVAATLRRDEPSARKVADAAGFPKAKSTLQDYMYVREIKEQHPELQCATPALTLAAQLQHVESMPLKQKGTEEANLHCRDVLGCRAYLLRPHSEAVRRPGLAPGQQAGSAHDE